MERVATGLAVVAIVAFAGAFLALRGAGTWFGSDPRPAAEQARMLEGGDCALGLDHKPLGKVVAPLAPSRSRPRGGYQLEGIDRRRMIQVDGGDVTIIPCESLRR